jgi:hypothetical protein
VTPLTDNDNHSDADFDPYDPILVKRVMAVVEDYIREKKALPSPAPLRDTMLAVAAVLHIDAVRTGGAGDYESIVEGFGESARKQVRAVIEAKQPGAPDYKQ